VKFTILGASGFIGTELVSYLKQRNHDCYIPKRNAVFSPNENLGHIIYCIGLTSDFRTRLFDTVDAHVCRLLEVMKTACFESFLYLSSTRVYSGSKLSNEKDPLKVNPNHLDYLYNISKLMGESVCLSIGNKKIRVARLSNVVGYDFESDNFLFSLIKEAVLDNKITLKQPLNICRDYIMINDVLEMIYNISTNGENRIYNIASGKNLSNKEIIREIHEITKCEIELSEESKGMLFPEISIKRIENEFAFKPNHLINELQELIIKYKKKM
jgi:nucleoside-diphosphate-sugar epimerase